MRKFKYIDIQNEVTIKKTSRSVSTFKGYARANGSRTVSSYKVSDGEIYKYFERLKDAKKWCNDNNLKYTIIK